MRLGPELKGLQSLCIGDKYFFVPKISVYFWELRLRFLSQPESKQEKAPLFYAAVANDCCQWASAAVQLLGAAQALSSRASLSDAVNELNFTANTVTPNEVRLVTENFL